jgi:hypothetical protein
MFIAFAPVLADVTEKLERLATRDHDAAADDGECGPMNLAKKLEVCAQRPVPSPA